MKVHQLLPAGFLVALLAAGCDDGGSASTAANTPPVADAGSAQSVTVGAVVTLDGSASNDADGDSLTYQWSWGSRPEGSTAQLTAQAPAAATFTADKAGEYVIRLVVNDGVAGSQAATVMVTAADTRTPAFSVTVSGY